MKVSKGERPFRSLFRDISKTIFSSQFIFRNGSSPCVQASIEQWIGDLTWKLEVKGSNPGSDKPFSSFYLILFWANIYEEVLFLVFFSTHYASYPSYDTSSWSNNNFEFIKFLLAFASLWKCHIKIWIVRPTCYIVIFLYLSMSNIKSFSITKINTRINMCTI